MREQRCRDHSTQNGTCGEATRYDHEQRGAAGSRAVLTGEGHRIGHHSADPEACQQAQGRQLRDRLRQGGGEHTDGEKECAGDQHGTAADSICHQAPAHRAHQHSEQTRTKHGSQGLRLEVPCTDQRGSDESDRLYIEPIQQYQAADEHENANLKARQCPAIDQPGDVSTR